MMKFLFKPLLAANYCASKWIVNKNLPKRVIPTALHTFTSPFAFISAGLYFVIIGSIDYRFNSYTPIFIGLVIVMLSVSFFIEKKHIFDRISKKIIKIGYQQFRKVTEWRH